jgi:hypothetical protein
MAPNYDILDVQYALEQTHVLHEPDRRIDTFSSTEFEFEIISELMDQVDTVRIRNGRIEAMKPVLFRPDGFSGFDFEGFGAYAEAFGDWLRENSKNLAVLRYGFRFTKNDISEHIVHESLEQVTGKLLNDIRISGNPMKAIIHAVDETWEISLLKFTVDMIEKSQGINVFDFKRRGLL